MSQGMKWKALGVLMACWALLFGVRLIEDREPPRALLKYKTGQVAKVERAGKGPTLVALSTPDSPSLSAARRPSKNIFAPLQFVRPKPRKAPAKPNPPPLPAPASPPPPSPEELATAQARKQMAQYRVLGYSAEDGEPRAFLGKGNKIFIAEIGEELEDRIVVAAINEQAVKLRETRTKLEATLPLKGEQ